jgi:hypothetical protein
MTVNKTNWQIKPDMIKMFRDPAIPGTLNAVTARKSVGGTCDSNSAILRVTNTEFDDLVNWLTHNVTIQISVSCDVHTVTSYELVGLSRPFAIVAAGIADIGLTLKRIESRLDGHLPPELCGDMPIPRDDSEKMPHALAVADAAFESGVG